MLKVDQYEFIRIGLRVYGLNISEIARHTGHSRNTIRKVKQQEPSGYSRRSYQPCPVMDPYSQVVDSWLKDDEEQHHKQRHTARRVYNRLVKEYGFDGAESTVRRYVRQAKVRLGINCNKAFIPGLPDAGQEAEVDWGDFTALIGGQSKRLKLFCLRSKYSRKSFVQAYPVERQQALFDAHIRAFNFFGGVFRRLIYDNLTTAVQKILKGKRRLEQDSFQKFRAYYTFEASFCTPGEAHEKGGVEGLVGFARRNFLVPIPKVETLEELNHHLLEECVAYGNHVITGQEQSVDQLFEQEKDHLLKLPKRPYSNQMVTTGKVDHYSTVITDKNRYSVPVRHAGYKVKTVLEVNTVTIYYDGREIARHPRAYGNNKWILEPDHYLDLLHERPGAFATARPIKQWRSQWPDNHEQLLKRLESSQGISKGTKDFIEILMLYRDYKPAAVEEAVKLALASGVSSGEAVRLFLHPGESGPKTLTLPGWPKSIQTDVSAYSDLGGVP